MFDNNKLGEIRPNQLITTFGPGAIVDAVKDSVTILDLNYWKEKGKKIIDGRLASYLNVDCFYMPRTSYSGDIPATSFPYMHVCSSVKCGRIFDVRDNFDLDSYLKFGVTCPFCHKPAYPSRFITICENGHMNDFPWSWWVHNGSSTCKGTLRMYSTGNTSTLADMWVECSCGAKRSMSGATQKENFEGMTCSGHHPFRPHHKNEKCDKILIPSQRGASNVYFINEAINHRRKIRFQKTEYNIRKEVVLHNNGEKYTFSPYSLIWDGDFYYVVGYSDKYKSIGSHRVDRIAKQPEILDEPAVPQPMGFDMNKYIKTTFRMYNAPRIEVELICDNSLMDAMIDRFGTDVHTYACDRQNFRVIEEVAVGKVFFNWIFGFEGKARIKAPENVKQQYEDMVRRAAEMIE